MTTKPDDNQYYFEKKHFPQERLLLFREKSFYLCSRFL
jgi:hypothetical protein